MSKVFLNGWHFSICNSLKVNVSQQLKLLRCEVFISEHFLFYKECVKVWVFLREHNPYMRQDSLCNIFNLKILGNRCIWGQADPFKDVCSSLKEWGGDQICNKNVFVAHWWSRKTFLQMFLLKCRVIRMWKPHVLTGHGICEGLRVLVSLVVDEGPIFVLNGTFAWIAYI